SAGTRFFSFLKSLWCSNAQAAAQFQKFLTCRDSGLGAGRRLAELANDDAGGAADRFGQARQAALDAVADQRAFFGADGQAKDLAIHAQAGALQHRPDAAGKTLAEAYCQPPMVSAAELFGGT